MKATTSRPAQARTTAPRTARQEGIIKEAIGLTDVKTLRARAFTVIADILLKILPASKKEKQAFSYYRAGMAAQSRGRRF